jgi:hypothetical protein
MMKDIQIDLQYQPLIEGPPPQAGNLWDRAASGDNQTINHWANIWIEKAKITKEHFGSFADRSIGKLYGINKYKPAIICGSGPSLKGSIKALKENRELKNPLLTVSCLHNFGYFDDEHCHADYYLTLDSGDVILDDVFEGRKQPAEHYWEQTEGKVLLATITTPKKLFELWRGPVYLFNIMIPDFNVHNEIQKVERFSHYVSAGGNALGGCLYVAQHIFSSHVIHLVGADFCFDYDNTFHSYKTKYDTIGNFVMWPDVYGMPRKTWASYLNFKFWFDWVACNIPGRYVNCSEGLLGSYREGNIKQFQYMSLHDALTPYKMHEKIYREHRDAVSNSLIKREEIKLEDLFSNPAYEQDLAMI